MSVAAVDAKWDGFLAKIKERFDQIMQESLVGCAQVYDQTQDYLPMNNAWTGMKSRGMQLQDKIQDTWDEQVEDAYENAGANSRQEDAARAKGEAMKDYIEVETERVEIAIFCNAARKMHAAAVANQPTPHCTQCSAPLQVPFTTRAVNVNCPSCGAINTLEPGTDAIMVNSFSHYIAREAAWQEWVTMHRAEEAWRDARTASIQIIQAWEDAQIKYWTKYLQMEAQVRPEVADKFDKHLASKLHHFYISMQHEKAWINAGKPRRIGPPH